MFVSIAEKLWTSLDRGQGISVRYLDPRDKEN